MYQKRKIVESEIFLKIKDTPVVKKIKKKNYDEKHMKY